MTARRASEAGRATLTRQPRFAARKAAPLLGRLPPLVPRITHARTPARARCYFRKLFPKSVVACMHVRPSQARIAAQQQGDNCKRAKDCLRIGSMTFLNDRGYYSKLSLFATYLNTSSTLILSQEREFRGGITLNGLPAKISLNHITR